MECHYNRSLASELRIKKSLLRISSMDFSGKWLTCFSCRVKIPMNIFKLHLWTFFVKFKESKVTISSQITSGFTFLVLNGRRNTIIHKTNFGMVRRPRNRLFEQLCSCLVWFCYKWVACFLLISYIKVVKAKRKSMKKF